MTTYNPETDILLGEAALINKNFREADFHFSSVLKRFPDNEAANFNLAKLAIKLDKFDKALILLRRLISISPHNDSYAALLIKLYLRVDNKEAAQNEFKKIVKAIGYTDQIRELRKILDLNDAPTIPPQKSDFRKKLHNEHTTDIGEPSKKIMDDLVRLFAAQHFPKLISSTQKLLKLYPGSCKLQNILGATHFSAGNYSEALESYNAAVATDPSFAEGYYNIGVLHHTLQAYDDAKSAYLKAIENDPNKIAAYHGAAKCLDAVQELEEAKTLIETAYQIDQKNVTTLNLMGKFEIQSDNLEKALHFFKSAHNEAPNDIDSINNLGAVSGRLNEFEAAHRYFDLCLKISPEFTVALVNKAEIFNKAHQHNDALLALKQAIKVKTNDKTAHFHIGITYDKLGQLAEAISSYKTALQLDQDFIMASINLGVVYQKQGNVKKAMECYEYAINKQPKDTLPYVNAITCLEKSNKLNELQTWFSRFEDVFGRLNDDALVYYALYQYRLKEYQEAANTIDSINMSKLSASSYVRAIEFKAKNLEKLGNYTLAAQAFEEMNNEITSRAKEIGIDPSDYVEKVKNRAAELKSGQTKLRRKNEINNNHAPVFIVGFPRSGTTLLDKILSAHSEIAVIEEKPTLSKLKNFLEYELNDCVHIHPTEDKLKIARTMYLEELRTYAPADPTNSLIIDKYPLYIVDLPLIHALFPKAKFLLAVRHPLDSILSNWKQNYALNPAMAAMSNIGEAVELYNAAFNIYKGCQNLYDIDMHVIKYEDLIKDFKTEIERTLKFLKLSWENEMYNYREGALNKVINTPSYSQVVQPIYSDSINLWEKYQFLFQEHLPKLENWLEEFNYNIKST